MKLIKMIIILIFATTFCKSQTILDPPSILDSLDQSMLNTEVTDFKCAWNWGQPGRRLDEAFSIGYSHGGFDTSRHALSTPNMNYIDQIPGFSAGHPNFAKLNSMAVQFDPAIKVYTTSAYYPPNWDTLGAVYGFINKNTTLGRVDSTLGSPTFHRYVLTKQPNMGDTLVLSNSWPQDSTFWLLDYSNVSGKLLTYLDFDTTYQDTHRIIRNFYPLNGTRWYLSANLKTSDTILPLDTLQNVLKIKLKYTLKDNTTGYIKFYKVPKQGLNSIDSLKSTINNGFRGLTRKDSVLSTPIDYFPITNKMLRTNPSGIGNSDITISAYFIARDSLDRTDPIPFLNPYFEPEEHWKPEHYTSINLPNYIDKLEVEVWYCGKKNCDIGWVRIATEQANELLTGKYDQEFVDACQKLLADTYWSGLNNKMHRFYVFDEFLRPYLSAIRYSNKLLGGLGQSEFDFRILPSMKMVDHCLEFREYWNGNSVQWLVGTASPYYNYGLDCSDDAQRNRKLLGTIFGSSGLKKIDQNGLFYDYFRFDSLNSGYETFLFGGSLAYKRWDNGYFSGQTNQNHLPSQLSWTDNTLNIFYNTTYQQNADIYQDVYGSLYNIEKQLFKLYYQKDALFVMKPIYFNLWVTSEAWFYNKDLADTNQSLAFLGSQSLRPLTDSEFRLTASMPLMLGIKGLFYWLKTGFNWNKSKPLEFIDPDFPNTLAIQTQANMNGTDGINPSIVGLDYILDNRLGGDYIVPYNDPNFSYHYKPNGQYDFTNLGIDQNHVFVGSRSLRYEIYKQHKHIKAVESVLLNLNLVCWLGVGHRFWYAQDPAYGDPLLGDTLLNTFCVSKNIKTRKLWQPVYNGAGYKPTNYEETDSRFFDLTILKKQGVDLTDSYVMGIANRRTDELMNTNRVPGVWQLDFVPSAEMFDNSQGPNKTFWDGFFWKKLGCREISICMKDITIPQNTEVAYKITELGYDNDSLKKEPWFNKPYNHLIDTNLLYGDTLRVFLQPGQAKLLNVEVVTPWTLTPGTLEYSNQTKLVAFPYQTNYNANGTDTMDMVRYHMVYTRKAGPTNDCSNVYYRRSLPVSRFEKRIPWTSEEYQLNDTLLVYSCSNPTVIYPTYNLASNFPSIVVRCDTVDDVLTPMVYVVYQASGSICNMLPKLRIIENVFPANELTITPPIGRQIADVNAQKTVFSSIVGSSNWGIPVINASSKGNYYVWNDSLLGIVAGYKLPDDRGWIQPSSRINFHGIPPSLEHFPGAYHPSLNTYSTISGNETDCALVWEEDSNGVYRDWNTQIFYTRLKYCANTGLVNYVTKNWAAPGDWYHNAIYNTDSTIVRLDDTNHTVVLNHLPIIYRDVEYYDASKVPEYNGMWPALAKADRVYWEGRATWRNDLQGIFMKFISIADSFNLSGCPSTNPMNWLIEGTPCILSAINDLAHPNVAQGKLVKMKSSNDSIYYSGAAFDNDSLAVINFVEYPHDLTFIAEVPRTADIWQINHGYFSLFYGPLSNEYSINFPYLTPKAHRIGSKGKSSHLARLPYINNDKTWEYGHRIYESSDDPSGQNPVIKSYDYLLFKKSYDAEANYMFYGFEDTSGNRSVFSPIYMTIDGRERSYVPRFDKTNKIYSDTLYSEYFEIGNYQDIDMLHFGSNKKCLDLKLQRKDDKKLLSVQTDKSSERFDYTKHSIHLLNGKSKEYRFAWIKTPKSDFTEMTILGLPPINEMTKDEMLGKTSINVDENYLDLSNDISSEVHEGSSLFIYPNPANEKVVIFYEQERKSNINISIYGMLGTTIKSVFTGDIDKGKYQYSVNTKDIPAGIYFVRVEGNNKTIVKKLVIE